MSDTLGINPNHNKLVEKWSPVLEGISDQYTARVTAVLLENQAKAIVSQQVKMNEDLSAGATTAGRLGTFQKFAFPLVRRVFPELIFNKIGSVQPMEGPVSQIFYLGSARQSGSTKQQLYSKYNLTYRGATTSAIFSDSNGNPTANIDLDTNTAPNTSAVFGGLSGNVTGVASTTYGGQIAGWPDSKTILGWSISAGEYLAGTAIPELNISIEQQPVVARTKKMRALWTIEASQDLKAYHNLDLERELTELMSKELELEIDRELLEDLRGIAYNVKAGTFGHLGGWYPSSLDNLNSNNFGAIGGVDPVTAATFTPAAFDYAQGTMPTSDFGSTSKPSNVFLCDFTSSSLPFAPQHVGHVYANLLGVLNFASQDIYKTTHRGPGNWIITSPLVGAMLESAAKLEGGIGPKTEGITNMGANKIEYRGKFAGKYDLYIDPLWPEDEIMMGYKGGSPLDGGFVYCPYIPIESLPTITDPETFQPRKGILTRYGKAAIQPAHRFYRIIRIVGPAANYLLSPFAKTVNVNTN
jgi:hypothetical protein